MSKFCGRCGTENRDEYSFCKKCGTPLTFSQSAEAPVYEQTAYEEFEGVSVRDLEDGIGKNSGKILKKFTNMKLADSKLSWCWPVAVLGFFFGFFGSAIWLFYRKMYKLAAVCLALGIVISAGRFFLMREPVKEYVQSTKALAQEMLDEMNVKPESDLTDETVNDIYQAFLQKYVEFNQRLSQTPQMRYSSLLQTLARYISAVVFGEFAMYFYKKHLFGKIKKLKAEETDDISYKYALTHSLGTSGGMAVLGVVLMITFSNIFTVLSIALSF